MSAPWTSPRTGITPDANIRSQGGCLALFGLPFLGFGLFFLLMLAGEFLSGKKNLTGLLVAIPFVSIFALVGGTMVYFGVRVLMGKNNPNAPRLRRTEPGARVDSWPFFQRFKNPKRGPRGATLLPLTTSVGVGLIVMIFVCLFWNGVVSALAFAILSKPDQAPLPAKIFVGVFGFLGLLIIFAVIHRITQLIVTGGSAVEIASEPLFPGGQTKLHLYTQRALTITEVSVSVRCQQHATYRRGKHSHTDRSTSHERQIYSAKNINTQAMRSFAEVALEIPADAFVTLRTSSHGIRWEVVVKINVPGKPDIEDAFTFRVAPGAAR